MDGNFRYYPFSSPRITLILDEIVRLRMTSSKPKTVVHTDSGEVEFEDEWVSKLAEDTYNKLLELLQYEQQLFAKQLKGVGNFSTCT
jgi:hypothetical protein